MVYSFKLIFPPKKVRSYYFTSKVEKDKWMTAIKKAIGYDNLNEYYDISEKLGEGSFSVVKAGVHRKSGKEVAAKILRKNEISPD